MTQCTSTSPSGRRCLLDRGHMERSNLPHHHDGPDGDWESWNDDAHRPPVKLWLVVIKDKDLYLEPDVGVAVIESDDESWVDSAGARMLQVLAERGRCRCVARKTEIQRGKFYRASMWFMPPPRAE